VTAGCDVTVIFERAEEGPNLSGRALLREAQRLAGELGGRAAALEVPALELHVVPAVAQALTGFVERTRPRALLLADGEGARQLAALLAHGLGTGAVVGCTALTVEDGRLVYREPVYGGWLEQVLAFAPGLVEIATVDVGLLAGASSVAAEETSAGRETLEVPRPGPAAYQALEVLPPDFRTVDLVHARRVLAAGMGGARPHLLPVVEELAELLQASIGVTRPVTDEGWLPKERLIGQTGRTVHPDLCLSLGSSGSPHHLAGVQDAGTFLCVNRDMRAPVFQYSDAGYLGDLEEVLPALVRRIKEWRDGLAS
jgi:electron transfer flavoprotein alpha subunit